MADADITTPAPGVQSVSPFDFHEETCLSGEDINIEAKSYCVKLNLRGNPNEPAFAKAVEEITGLALPLAPNTVHRGDTSSLYWLGPDEWQWRLASDNPEPAEALVHRFRADLQGASAALVDVSDYYSIIRLEGDRTFDVLAKGTPLDIGRQLADSSACAQTRFGHASVLLCRCENAGDSLAVDLQVRWSFAEYLWLYLAESVREYQN